MATTNGERPKKRFGIGSQGSPQRVLLLSATLAIVAVAIYVFVYQQGRVEAATVRNFRALNAAADRLNEVVDKLPQVAAAHSFNIPRDHLMELQRRLSSRNGAQTSDSAPLARTYDNYDLAATILGDDPIHRDLVDALLDLVQDHQRKYEASATLTVKPRAIPRRPNRRQLDLAGCHQGKCRGTDWHALTERPACEGMTKEVTATADGMSVRVIDCRPFTERSKSVYDALAETVRRSANDPMLGTFAEAMDLFGIESTVALRQVMDQTTDHLAGFFDGYVVADSEGRVLFEVHDYDRLGALLDAPRRRMVQFSRVVDIADLLLQPVGDDDLLGTLRDTPQPARYAATGRSLLKAIDVGDIELSVFIQPFVLVGLTDPGAAQGARAGSRAHYMAGIVGSADLRADALRWRTSSVTIATLVVLAVLSLFPLLWLVTGGERATVRLAQLLSVVLGLLGAVAWFTLAALTHVETARRSDDLDQVLDKLHGDILGNFQDEFRQKHHHLRRFAPFLALAKNPPAPGPAGRFFCSTDTSSKPALPLADFQVAWLMDSNGMQLVCDNRQLAPTPKLPLAFRGYFSQPKAGSLWRSQDRCPFFLDRIDTVVQGTKATVLAFPVARGHRPMATSSPDRAFCDFPNWRRNPESEFGVLAATLRFSSLDDLILPPHYGMAVVHRETGTTWYHSNEALAMATNFVADVDYDASLVATLYLKESRTLALMYNGVPVRARIAKLADGLPLALVVYRTHDYEDSLATLPSMFTVGVFVLCLLLLALLSVAWRVLPRLLGRYRASPLSNWGLAVLSGGPKWVIATSIAASLAVAVATAFLFWSAATQFRGGVYDYVQASITDQLETLDHEVRELMRGLADTEWDRSIWDSGDILAASTSPVDEQVTLRALYDARLMDITERDAPTFWQRVLAQTTSSNLSAALTQTRLGVEDVRAAILPGEPWDERESRSLNWWIVPALTLPLVLALPCLTMLRLFGRPRRVVPISPTKLQDFRLPKDPPMRLVLVHRTASVASHLETRLRTHFDELRTGHLGEDGKSWTWSNGSEPILAHVAYFVTGLEEVLYREDARNAFFKALRTLLDEDASIILVSRSLPQYYLAEMIGDTAVSPVAPSWLEECSAMMGKFDTRVVVAAKRPLPDGDWSADVAEAMCEEADANPDLRGLAMRVGNGMAPDEPYAATNARARFLAEAAGYFNRQWLASTADERLQIYSLAKNGVVNAREVAAVSSLATRGIITEKGAIKLRSRAFKHYVALKPHDSLLQWRAAGRHNLWRLIWPPAAVLTVLALVFFVNANPEVIGIMLALGGALLGIAPVINSLIKPGVPAGDGE